jgi:hypothetical protein
MGLETDPAVQEKLFSLALPAQICKSLQIYSAPRIFASREGTSRSSAAASYHPAHLKRVHKDVQRGVRLH